jgi:hypothetical protein
MMSHEIAEKKGAKHLSPKTARPERQFNQPEQLGAAECAPDIEWYSNPLLTIQSLSILLSFSLSGFLVDRVPDCIVYAIDC